MHVGKYVEEKTGELDSIACDVLVCMYMVGKTTTHMYTPNTCIPHHNSSQLQRAVLVRCFKHVAVGGDLLYEQV